jgi:hypothetical protein
MPQNTCRCGAAIQATVKCYWTLGDDGVWTLEGQADDGAELYCANDCEDLGLDDDALRSVLHDLTLACEAVAPGTTWVGSDPSLTAEQKAAILQARDLPDETATCQHCDRRIVKMGGRWVDPEATGDDAVWRETCDTHNTFTAEHEPR